MVPSERRKTPRSLILENSDLDTFVALDLETTGLDPQRAEIIEIGAVKVEKGEIKAQFDQLVRPEGPLPPAITRLTGISEDMVRRSPPLSQVIPFFTDFIQEFPLVIHNAPFDLSFLQKHPEICLSQRVYDSLELARLVLPRLVNHKLQTLVRFFQIEQSLHRAANDAQAVALIFLRLVELLLETDLASIQRMLKIVQGTDSSLTELLAEVASVIAKQSVLTKIRSKSTDANYLTQLFNIGGHEAVEALPGGGERSQHLDLKSVLSVFDIDGPLQQQLKGYEKRQEQLDMVKAVAEAFNQGELLMVEAGTGVGKSLAYLVPAIYWAVQNNDRVIVSTNTKNLQEQLFYKDLPELSRILDIPFRSVLLKGRSNYICLNKWYTALSQIETAFSPEERRELLPLVIWVQETETGDIAENSGFKSKLLWNKLCAESNYCLGQKCKYYQKCFVMKVRREALRAHIVVVNHSLLFSDLCLENSILGSYQNLIFDEAHNIEKVAAQYLGRQLSIWSVKALTARLYSKGVTETGVLAFLRSRLLQRGSQPLQSRAFLRQVELLIELSRSVWQETREVFSRLAGRLDGWFSEDGGPEYYQKIRFKGGDQLARTLTTETETLRSLLGKLAAELSQLSQWLLELPEGSFQNQDEVTAEIGARLVDCQQLYDDLTFLTSSGEEDWVYWVELPTAPESFDLRILSAPLNISELLASELYSRLRTGIFTSATLTVPSETKGKHGDFGYFAERVGIGLTDQARVRSLALGSPFDYNRQTLVCIPSSFPSPKSADFQKAIEGLIGQLLQKVKRRTLVLFTSYRMLNEAYYRLRELTNMEGTSLLGQGLDGSRSNIVARFIEYPGAVLLGTESFWEGVDLPGEALEVLVIVKFPFAVPTEPIVAAHMERLEKMGINSFLHYSLPEAVIKFRQGFGRLIRTKSDKGVIVILDTRALTKRYGRAFLESLPTRVCTFDSVEKMVKTIQSWFLRNTSSVP